MSRLNKAQENLLDIWGDLDEAYVRIERSFEKLSSMPCIPNDLSNEIERFDLFAITSIKEHIEILVAKLR